MFFKKEINHSAKEIYKIENGHKYGRVQAFCYVDLSQ